MKKNIFSVLMICAILVSCAESEETTESNAASEEVNEHTEVVQEVVEVPKVNGTFIVDSSASSLYWRGDKSAKVDFHEGLIVTKGDIVVTDDQITGGVFHFDIGSIYNTDLDANGKTGGLAKHLKNADFFNQDEQGMPKFEVKSVIDGMAIGDFTVRELTQEISFPATVEVTENSVHVIADSVHIPMTGFGMDYYEEYMKPTVIVSVDIMAK